MPQASPSRQTRTSFRAGRFFKRLPPRPPSAESGNHTTCDTPRSVSTSAMSGPENIFTDYFFTVVIQNSGLPASSTRSSLCSPRLDEHLL